MQVNALNSKQIEDICKINVKSCTYYLSQLYRAFSTLFKTFFPFTSFKDIQPIISTANLCKGLQPRTLHPECGNLFFRGKKKTHISIYLVTEVGIVHTYVLRYDSAGGH